jgi:hypothetical protein
VILPFTIGDSFSFGEASTRQTNPKSSDRAQPTARTLKPHKPPTVINVNKKLVAVNITTETRVDFATDDQNSTLSPGALIFEI